MSKEKNCDELTYNKLQNQKRELEYHIVQLKERLEQVAEQLEECEND